MFKFIKEESFLVVMGTFAVFFTIGMGYVLFDMAHNVAGI